MPKSFGQKGKILYILDFLEKNTDENARVSTKEIIDYLALQGIRAERKTVYSDIETLREFGYDIELTEGRGGGYRLLSRPFELAEIKLLIDAVQSSRFISQRKAERLTDTLASFAGKNYEKLLKRRIVGDIARTDNEAVIYSIDAVFDAIHERKKLSFKYYQYAVLEGKMQKSLRREGKIYTVEPICLVRSEDYYYLVASDEGVLKHFRADRLTGIKITDEKITAKTPENMDKYIKGMFSMYGGESVYVTLLCTHDRANVIADRYGADVPVRVMPDGRFSVTVPVRISPNFYSWLFSFEGSITVTSPAFVRDEMLNKLNQTLEKFKGETNS